MTRAKLDPQGGRLGFTGAYGGVPFPIIDTSDRNVAGSQLIWNHLTDWGGLANYCTFSPAFVVIDGKPILTQGQFERQTWPYFDPKGSPESFDGYFVKIHTYSKAPASAVGQELLLWHTTNVNVARPRLLPDGAPAGFGSRAISWRPH